MNYILPRQRITTVSNSDIILINAVPVRSSDDWLKKEILRVYDGNHQVYGVRKVWRQLLREGIRVARCTVARLMAVMGLAGVLRGKKVRTTVSRKAVAAGDRVNRQFVAERSDQLWVADFTYGVPGVQGGHGCLNEPRVCLEY